VLDHGQSAGDN